MVFLVGGIPRLPTVSAGPGSVSSRVVSRQPQTHTAAPSRGSYLSSSHQPYCNSSASNRLSTQSNATAGTASAVLEPEQKLHTQRGYVEAQGVRAAVLEPLLASGFGQLDLQPRRSSHSGEGLPEELYRLQDPTAPVQLPAPGAVNLGLLDNWKLDKLIAALGRNKATWRRALVLYEWLKDSGHDLDDRLCTTLIRLCADHSDAMSALGVYEWMRAPKEAGGAALRPTTYTYTAAMRAALTANMLDRAVQIWEDCQVAGITPDCRLCITYIEVATRMNQTDKALALYSQMRAAAAGSPMAPTVHAYTAAMRAASEGGRWFKALDVWEDMKRAGCEPTGHAYAAVISACAAGSDWVRALSLFEEMTLRGIEPDVVSCTALITALAAAGEADKAENVVTWMINYGLKPNVRTYTALLTAMGNAKQWGRAVEMLYLMQTPEWGSVTPNAYTYSALLKSLGEHGQWQLAEAVFSDIEQQLLAPEAARGGAATAKTHLAALVPPPPPPPRLRVAATAAEAAESAGDSGKEAERLPQEAANSNGAGSMRVWSSASQLNGLSLDISSTHMQPVASSANGNGKGHGNGNGHGSVAAPVTNNFSLFSTQPSGVVHVAAHNMVQQTLSNINLGFADQLTMAPTSAASAAAPAQPAPAAVGRHNNKDARSCIVNEVVCGALMLAYERAGKWAEAVGVLTRARALGLQPNTVMYNTAISAAGKAGQLDVAETLFNSVTAPDAVTHETLIAAYGMAGTPEKAEAIFRTMVRRGFRPRDYAYCGLVAAHSLDGNTEAALAIWRRLQRDGITPTVHVYNALLAACERGKLYNRALEILAAMKRDKVEPNAVTQQLMMSVGRQGAQNVENQQVAAAALSAAFAAAGSLLIQTGMF